MIALEPKTDAAPPSASRGSIAIAEEDLARILALYEDGRALSAYELARTFGPLEAWAGTSARVLAGRLAPNLGAPRLGKRLHARAWRGDPTDPEACYYWARELLGLRGPLRAWRFLERVGPLEDAADATRADWLATHAIALGQLRDFDAAEAWLARAEEARPEWPWLQVERAQLYELEDRYEDALAAARRALDLRPWYRPAVQAAAHVLQLLDRDGEALELLAEAALRLENGPIVAQLAAMQSELGHHDEARRSFDRYAELSPLMEPEVRRWLAGRRSDEAYECGDVAAAIDFGRESGLPFFVALADRLEAAGSEPRRVVLDVGFVRQHYQTCAPATLAAIGRYWGMPTDHLEVAEAICYDGTPDHRGRSWAEQSGWVAREFVATWDAAVALLDRGIPFTLTTVEPLNAHLQAVIGYDARRRTLLIRDPTLPYSGEAFADGFLEAQRSTGPRGMALVPRERAGLLDNLDLPEASLYDHVYRLQLALHDHDRARAAAAYEDLRAEAPDHRLTLQARRVLANYDANVTELLAATVRLLESFPDDVNLRLAQLACLRDQARRDERLDLLRDLCARPGADPVFCRQYAQELLVDSREHPTAVRLVRRALRARPLDAASLSLLADLAWERQEFAEALELHRLAACLDDKDERLAWAYFNAARYFHREEETLRLLHGRFRRFGTRSCQPARTLYWAYAQLERMAEAFAVLDEALRARPDDGDLLLFAAEAHGMHGDFDLAAGRLAVAEGHCRRSAWLRAAAKLASARGDLAGALEHWRGVLDTEPAALDANAAVARLLAETEGRAAALDHLARSCARFPHNFALHQSWIDWLRDDPPDAAEPVVRRILEIHPADAWSRRELALVLSRQGRHDEALAEMELARQLEPSSTTEASVRAQVLEGAGRRAEAREAYREAIRRSADNDLAIARLIDSCDSPAGRLEALAFIEAELERQVIFGDGLIAFARHARGALGPDELLATLRKAWEARPDLWHAWSALIRELLGREDRDAALDLARQAVARFPLLPRIWLDLAAVGQARGDRDGEIEALDHALRINPGWGAAARQLAMAHERGGDFAASRAILERALGHAPLDAYNHGCLADALWNLGEKEPALERLGHALRLDPDYDWAWSTLPTWAGELGRPDAAADLARELTAGRGGEAGVWSRLARTLEGAEHLDERLAALDRAIVLDPRLVDAHDLKAELLAGAGRFDEAEAACRPAAPDDRPPYFTLLGRAAWVAARRGDLQGAIARMRTVVAEHPDYYWGLRNLAEWLCDAGTAAEYLEAAEALTRLAGDDPVAVSYRGEARLKAGDRAGAREDFGRALALAPGYAFAAMNLFDLELADEDHAAAGNTLEVLKARVGGEYIVAREVQLAVGRSDQAAATEALGRLCAGTEGTSDWPIRVADRAFVQAGWAREAEAIYRDCLDRAEVHPQVGALWIDRCAARRDWRCAGRLDDLLARGEVGRRAMVAYLTALGKAKAGPQIAACLRRHSRALRDQTSCWGIAGYALTTAGRHRAAADWLRDWADRTDAEPWMLINLVIALRAQHRVDEANRVSRRALELPPDGTTPYHAVWLALDLAIGGDDRAAAERLGTPDLSAFDSTNRYLFQLTKLLIRQQQAGSGDRRRVLAETTRELAAIGRAGAIPAEDHGAVVNAYHRALRRMARDRGRILGTLWRLGRRLEPPRRCP